jgi:hypothetical protein
MFMEYIDAQAPKAGIRIFTIAGDRSPRAFQTTKGPILEMFASPRKILSSYRASLAKFQ